VLSQFVEFSIIGIASGGLYVLAGLGFVIIYKGSSVFNFAMGEMMMLGAYFFFAIAVQLHLGWPIGLLFALAGSALLAMLIERMLLRPMLGRPVVVLVMITFGLGSVLRGFAALVWGPGILQVPDFLPRAPMFLGDVLIPGKLAWSFLVVGVISLAFIGYYRFSRAGIAIRATAADQITADTLGINIRQVFSRSWALGGMLAACAGISLAGVNGLTP
jgi:branched-chain amino acid transport system permease protein